jgi:uncharacterized coiled-coil protein SlyX
VSDPGTPLPNDRPLENHVAELNRKVADQSRQLQDLMSLLAAQAAPQPPAPPARSTEYSDEQLGELARAGSVEASLKLQERVAHRAAQAVVQADQQTRFVQSQLSTLYAKYPHLANPQDPLTMEAMKAKSVLLRSGRANDALTDLEAIKLAIVDNPRLAYKDSAPTPAPGFSRPGGSVQPIASLDGQTNRREPVKPNAPGRKLHPKVLRMARDMGIKDPEAALARQEERQRKGQSSFSPGVIAIVRDQEG